MDYIELFVYESACHCLVHVIMYMEVYRHRRVNETSPEWILGLALSDNGAMLTDVIKLIVRAVMVCTLLLHLGLKHFLTFLMFWLVNVGEKGKEFFHCIWKHFSQSMPLYMCIYTYCIQSTSTSFSSYFHVPHCSYLFPSLLCYLCTVSESQNESSRLFGSFKHRASGSLRLWLVCDWTLLCCWAQGGLAYSDDLTH